MSRKTELSVIMRILRDLLKLHQGPLSTLAVKCGVSVSTLYNWHNGKTSSPHFYTVWKVAKHFGRDPLRTIRGNR